MGDGGGSRTGLGTLYGPWGPPARRPTTKPPGTLNNPKSTPTTVEVRDANSVCADGTRRATAGPVSPSAGRAGGSRRRGAVKVDAKG